MPEQVRVLSRQHVPDEVPSELAAVRRLLHAAGEASVPPGPFDLATSLRAGRRRARRRRGAHLLGAAALVAAVAAGLTVTPDGFTRSAPAPAAPTLTPTSPASPSPNRSSPAPTAAPSTSTAASMLLGAVLADPAAGLSAVQFSDPQHAAAKLSACDSSCTAFALVTADAWRSWHALPLPSPGGAVVQLPDGTALVSGVTAGDGHDLALLRPDGTSAPVTASTQPQPAAPGLVLLNNPAPGLVPDGADGEPLWAYDPARRTLRPLAGAPRADLAYTAPVTLPDGTLVALLGSLPSAPTAVDVIVARSSDGGRSWTTSTLRPHDAKDRAVASAAAGPGGQLAVAFTTQSQGSTPLVELDTSTDGGTTWQVSRTSGSPPGSVGGGLAWTRTGVLLLADDIDRRLWVQRPGAPLAPATGAPADAQSLTATGAGIITAQSSERDVEWTSEGTHWTTWKLPTSAGPAQAPSVASPSPASR